MFPKEYGEERFVKFRITANLSLTDSFPTPLTWWQRRRMFSPSFAL